MVSALERLLFVLETFLCCVEGLLFYIENHVELAVANFIGQLGFVFVRILFSFFFLFFLFFFFGGIFELAQLLVFARWIIY